MPKRNRRIGDVHEIDVTGQNKLVGHFLDFPRKVLHAAAYVPDGDLLTPLGQQVEPDCVRQRRRPIY
jgi:hypothetical protein